MSPVHAFTHAIVRRPARAVVAGLRAGSGPDPDFEGVVAEHAAYCAALLGAGLCVVMLPALEAFPDSLFVEDVALVFPEGAIALRPGAPSRAGEVAAITATLRERFAAVLELDAGRVDGGDILTTPEAVLIGLSTRTDRAGAEALARLLHQFGRRARLVETPPGVLHFKSDCALIDDEIVLATPRLAASDAFAGLRVIETAPGEEGAANALRVNDALFVGAAYKATAERLQGAGYAVTPLAVEQIGRIDAGLSCLSLRWRAEPASGVSAAPR